MPVIREFLCGDCGKTFESMLSIEEVACPQCSAPEPERVFLTPPAIKSPQTARKDEITKDLAQAYGLSNMSNRDGEAVMARRGQVGPQQAHAQWAAGGEQWVQAASKAPPSIVPGRGFAPPQPMYVGKVKS